MSKYYKSPVIGIDVSANFSMVSILAPNGDIYKKPFKVNHDSDGFELLLQKIRKTEEEFSTKSVTFMEATGIYHLTLFCFLKDNKIDCFVINPLVTNCNKNKSIRKVKNDKVDSITIAKTGKFENVKASNYLDIDIYLLRDLCREYYNLVDTKANIKKQISSTIRITFPGYQTVFSDTTGKTSLNVLKSFTTPKKMINTPKDEIINLLKKSSRKGNLWARKKYNELITAADNAIKIGIESYTFINKLTRQLKLLETYETEINLLIEEIKEILNSNKISDSFRKSVDLISSVSGVGFITSITLASEIGDIKRFKKPKQLVAFFGIDPSVSQSGKFNSTKNVMSKRGTSYGRKALYAVALTSVRKKRNGELNNPVLFKYYKTNLQGKKKKVALVAIMHKLLKYIFAILRDEKPYEIRDPKLHSKMYLENNSRLIA